MAREESEMSGASKDRILVLDANIMLRAVLGTRVRLLIERYAENVPLFIPSVCVAEVKEYLPVLCAKRNWNPVAALNLLDALLKLVRVVEHGFYGDFEEHSLRRIGSRDTDDWPVVALALALRADIWTEDTDFFGSGLAIWTTETVEIYLRDDPWQINEPPHPYYGSQSVSLLEERCAMR